MKFLKNQFKHADRYIQMTNKDLNQTINKYDNNLNTILKESQEFQREYLRSLKKMLTKFIDALQIQSSSSARTLQKLKPSKSCTQTRWKNVSCSIDDKELYYEQDIIHFFYVNNKKKEFFINIWTVLLQNKIKFPANKKNTSFVFI